MLCLTAILLKINTRMKLLFSHYLGDCSYNFQGSFELISMALALQLQFPCSFSRMELQKSSSLRHFQEFSAITVT